MRNRRTFKIIIIILICVVITVFSTCQKLPLNPYDNEGAILGYFTGCPSCDPPEGTYYKDIQAILTSVTDDAVIYYTTDGSDPTIDSQLYSSPITISGDGTTLSLNALAYNEATKESVVTNHNFLVDYLDLEISASDYGTVNPSGAQRVQADVATNIMAEPAFLADLSSWSVVSGENVVINDVTSPDTSVKLVDSSSSIRADFTLNAGSKVVPVDGDVNDHFGSSVSISGDYAIIGADCDDDDGDYSGSAHIFYRDGSGWSQQAKLTASDAAEYDRFGLSVSISGDYAVIGGLSGSAYIFYKDGSGWSQQATLTPYDAPISSFGNSVSLSGDYALISAPFDDDSGNNSGSAYIFYRSGTSWSQQAKLIASDGAEGNQFGHSVSISEDYALIGAHFDDDNAGGSGSAYIFYRSGTSWSQQAKLTASDGAEGDQFGQSVSISEDYALIGAFYDDGSGNNSGSAYIFYRSGTSWSQQAKLTASDAAEDAKFGSAVSILGDYAAIGASHGNDYMGSGYIFRREGTTWIQYANLTAYDGANSDYFGYAIAISEDSALLGANGDDDSGSYSGSAYFF